MNFSKLQKRLRTASLTVAVIAMGCFTQAHAQTSTTNAPGNVPSAPASFFGSVEGYFLSFDTNSTTFETEKAEVWTGVDSGNDTLGALFGVSVPFGSFSVEAVMENADVAGTVLSFAAGGGYRIVHYDTELTAGLDIGYRLDHREGFVSPFIDVRKALTPNTYAGVRLYYEQEFAGNTKAHSPGVYAITGFKF
jgi:hypothetical protein